jgi:hypothetical protein
MATRQRRPRGGSPVEQQRRTSTAIEERDVVTGASPTSREMTQRADKSPGAYVWDETPERTMSGGPVLLLLAVGFAAVIVATYLAATGV